MKEELRLLKKYFLPPLATPLPREITSKAKTLPHTWVLQE